VWVSNIGRREDAVFESFTSDAKASSVSVLTHDAWETVECNYLKEKRAWMLLRGTAQPGMPRAPGSIPA
jgi:hypothetical protein